MEQRLKSKHFTNFGRYIFDMKEIVLLSGAVYGGLAVLFGAFGAHALKSKLSADQLKSFETGVKYQMYHALVLLILGFQFNFDSEFEYVAAWFFIFGIFLFSFSIYALVLSSARGEKMKLLGPITPLGGLLLLIGWVLLVFIFLK